MVTVEAVIDRHSKSRTDELLTVEIYCLVSNILFKGH